MRVWTGTDNRYERALLRALPVPPERRHRTRQSGRRLPFAPLEQTVGAPNTCRLAMVLGVHPRQVYRWRSYGVTEVQADELAIAVGVHPAEVWPDWLTS